MKFKHCLLLSVLFASLLIGTLLLISKPIAPEKTAVLTNSSTRMYVLPAQYNAHSQTTMHHHL